MSGHRLPEQLSLALPRGPQMTINLLRLPQGERRACALSRDMHGRLYIGMSLGEVWAWLDRQGWQGW